MFILNYFLNKFINIEMFCPESMYIIKSIDKY
jgi:hypothetical protein